MVATMSTMLSLGTEAPDFSLPDTRGKMVSLSDFEKAPALLVIFMCNHCPYVKHVADALTVITREYQERGVAVVGINANDWRDSAGGLAGEDGGGVEAARLQLPVLVRPDAGDGEGLSRRLHAGLLRLRQAAAAGLSRPVRFEPAGERHPRHRRRPPRGVGRRGGRATRPEEAARQCGLQHQVAAGQRAGLPAEVIVRGALLGTVPIFAGPAPCEAWSDVAAKMGLSPSTAPRGTVPFSRRSCG